MSGELEAIGTASDDVPPRYAEMRGARAGPLFISLLAAISGALVLYLFNPAQFAFYPTCVFYKSAGLLCPGCGSLRALHQLLHGHLATALHFNALLVLSLPLMGWFGWRLAVANLTNRPLPIVIRPAWLWFGLAVLIAFGILRNLPFAPLTWLAP